MGYDDEIAVLRDEIDRINTEIVGKIAERVDVALKIGEVKSRYGQPVRDPVRERRLKQKVKELARSYELDDIAVERIFSEIIGLCANAEERARR